LSATTHLRQHTGLTASQIEQRLREHLRDAHGWRLDPHDSAVPDRHRGLHRGLHNRLDSQGQAKFYRSDPMGFAADDDSAG
jgi:hypothetical protein